MGASSSSSSVLLLDTLYSTTYDLSIRRWLPKSVWSDRPPFAGERAEPRRTFGVGSRY